MRTYPQLRTAATQDTVVNAFDLSCLKATDQQSMLEILKLTDLRVPS
jgi:hypothetical protein